MVRNIPGSIATTEMSSEYVKSGPLPSVEDSQGKYGKESYQPIPVFVAIWTYVSYFILTVRGHFIDILRKIGIVKVGREIVDSNVSSNLY